MSYWNTVTPVHLRGIDGHFLATKAELSSCNRGHPTLKCLEYLLSGPLKKRFPTPCDITDKNAWVGEGEYYQKVAGHPLERLKIKVRGKSCDCHLEDVIGRYGDVVPRDRRKDLLNCRHGFEIELLLTQATLRSPLHAGSRLD